MTVEAFAPAKINLTLHVTDQRSDGYHLLDSLVTFVDVGDAVTVEKAEKSTLTVTGPMAAGVPTDSRNLVLRAAEMLGVPAKITLNKHLPAAAGIGGGSSDAAAALRALTTLYNLALPSVSDLLSLGADVPVCVPATLARMTGIGEQVAPVVNEPVWPMILINPRVSVPTGPVFQALPSKNNPPMPEDFPDWKDWDTAAAWLTTQRNDLEAPAIGAQPSIGQVLTELHDSKGCALARMSGSGATCFGIYFDDDIRDRALKKLRGDFPNWWIMPTRPLGHPMA
ncbi:4-diphosphocytidyl-2-C-methyl-D-erythritol kinase [Shimia gijangensis]|uniref:4-diphosphocytidyl-2-C-methyl-D-erythritol kinase n=1 Tax=Shimia gijangensis TaxID=1470563 RepID=A0A1M6FF89_9RHOB|nr:4-(cytidine 5'-diphospho)-2-C-methyl-D-erythritol kinase [Shimia gijangensis]SHI96292.1 4-diphosphocytidyl-2-C-methyl-D-erythritol kinase [Shimia gijangensis]